MDLDLQLPVFNPPPAAAETTFTFNEALASPCLSCSTSPCCRYLPLHQFKVETLHALDHARYLLNFERIELALTAEGIWHVYYTYPCRFLDRDSALCTVHNMPEQPNICVTYNPFTCWYRHVFGDGQTADMVRIDRRRLDYVIERVQFDSERRIVAVPTWEALLDGFAALPVTEPEAAALEPVPADAAFAAWQKLAVTGEIPLPVADTTYTYEDSAIRNPCATCEAYCCTTLTFPKSIPEHAHAVDYYRFCLGFPGVELGISDESWSLVVKTRCRHVDGNRCSIFGQPERPLICSYYDAWKCTYRPQFGLPQPAGFVRVRHEQFAWLSECFDFGEHGEVVQLPPADLIRVYLETCWREAAGAPAAG